MTTDGLVDGRYRLHEQLGSGGMGVVWRATDELLGREVAIKRIRLDRGDGELAEIDRQRTLREARIAAQLHQPHIVSIFDVLTVEREPWLVLEYLPSESLAEVIKRGTLTPQQAARIGFRVADALATAHAAQIIHRDVKPGNVLIGTAGQVKLTDFGISRVAGDVTLTGTGMLSGTPAYFAPEICRGEQGGSACDVYSLGATLYAAVEGAPPFGDGRDNILHLVRRIASGQVPPPEHAGSLTPVLARLLDNDPAARPDATTARELLRQVTDGTVAPAPDETPDEQTVPDTPRHHRRTWILAAALTSVAALGVALLLGVRPQDSTPVASPPVPTTTAPTGPTSENLPSNELNTSGSLVQYATFRTHTFTGPITLTLTDNTANFTKLGLRDRSGDQFTQSIVFTGPGSQDFPLLTDGSTTIPQGKAFAINGRMGECGGCDNIWAGTLIF